MARALGENFRRRGEVAERGEKLAKCTICMVVSVPPSPSTPWSCHDRALDNPKSFLHPAASDAAADSTTERRHKVAGLRSGGGSLVDGGVHIE